MACANPGFIYCPRLQYWRTPSAKLYVCPDCQYLGCEHNFKYLVQVPAKCPDEGTTESPDRTLRTEGIQRYMRKPTRPIKGHYIANIYYPIK